MVQAGRRLGFRKKPTNLFFVREFARLDHFQRDDAVGGTMFGSEHLPHAAGVGFSRNLYRWSQEIRRQDGFARLVWGLGTRAVDRVGNDYR